MQRPQSFSQRKKTKLCETLRNPLFSLCVKNQTQSFTFNLETQKIKSIFAINQDYDEQRYIQKTSRGIAVA